jgi:5'-methylthioadenosine phosphorylase
MIAIFGGTGLLESSLFSHFKEKTIETEYGPISAYQDSQCVFIQRHGKNSDTPPHRINYRANIAAVRHLGIKRIVAVNSTGSLTKELPPGTLLIPHDYFNLFNIPTFFDNEMKFTIPGLDDELRELILGIARTNGIDVVGRGVYFQVEGPILETKAEINYIKQIGDVVGMTMAKEAILAKEIDLAYASICMIDNYANGIIEAPLTLDEIASARAINLNKLERFLSLIIKQVQR